MFRSLAALAVLTASISASASTYRLVLVPAADETLSVDDLLLKSVHETMRIAAMSKLGPRNWMIAPDDSLAMFFKNGDYKKEKCEFKCAQALGRYYTADVVVTTEVQKSTDGHFIAFVRVTAPTAARDLTATRVEGTTDAEFRNNIEKQAGAIFERLSHTGDNEPGPWWWLAVRAQGMSPSGLAGAEAELKLGMLAFGVAGGLRSGVSVAFLPLDQHGGPYFRAGFSTNRPVAAAPAETADVIGASAGWDFRMADDHLSICAGLGSAWQMNGDSTSGWAPMADVRVGWVFF